MKSLKIKLDSVDKVKKFVHLVATVDCYLDLVSNRYTIDAKSIMGIFSLDLSKELELVVSDDKCFESLAESLSEFVV